MADTTEQIQRYTGVDDVTMQQLADTYRVVRYRYRSEAPAAVLQMVKGGVAIEHIIESHLDVCGRLTELAHWPKGFTLTDAADLVAGATTTFQLDNEDIYLLPQFIRHFTEMLNRPEPQEGTTSE